jgi:hypothetical protein
MAPDGADRAGVVRKNPGDARAECERRRLWPKMTGTTAFRQLAAEGAAYGSPRRSLDHE